eukprot:CAMPEP_0206222974 /NCGR_PEP_ID=MMETSP0047_2-20121206/6242_1 /ASSEMBLY_ACC=CAM_ASM_000192 /TAXON_ID=195065 /ORGANISM="Chroomonas mesostigmatica_cf, Strain CCMP1168" /LENGTH=74 /DNA_ID=CAMNT_0053645827 /DNA_START=123 /DNA_END=343 /DNA_ORIENTATION=+
MCVLFRKLPVGVLEVNVDESALSVSLSSSLEEPLSVTLPPEEYRPDSRFTGRLKGWAPAAGCWLFLHPSTLSSL